MCSVFISVMCSSPAGFHVPTQNQFSLLWEHVQVGKTVNSAWKRGILLNVQLLKVSALDPSGSLHSFQATPGKRRLLEPLPADSFVQNTAQQRHHPFFLPTHWLLYKGAEFQARRTSSEGRGPSFSRQPLLLCSRVGLLRGHYFLLSSSSTYLLSSVCCLGVYKVQLWSHL